MTCRISADLAQHTLDTLRAVAAIDSDDGITDPDVQRSIDGLAAALQLARGPGQRRHVQNRWGFVRGERVRMTGGSFAGFAGVLVGVSNASLLLVEIGGAMRHITARYVERAA
jgi:transcription antitermination factor NusG